MCAESCTILCDPMDCSPSGSSIHGIFQARILEQVAVSSSRGIFQTQGWNPYLLHWQVDFLKLVPPGKPISRASDALIGITSRHPINININILGVSELKCMAMGKFNSDDHYVYFCGKESLRKNGVALIVKKRAQNSVLGCNFRNNRMISVHFQGKSFNITVIQVYALTTNAGEDEVEWFYEDLQDFLELTPQKMSFSSLGTGMQK